MYKPNNHRKKHEFDTCSKMKLSFSGIRTMKAILPLFIVLSLFCILATTSSFAADKKTEDSTDLSEMDWSDDPVEEDLSRESWADEATDENAEGALSEMSWEDEEGENDEPGKGEAHAAMTREEEMALDAKERGTHIAGFLIFIGYIFGAILTGYFTRNRKLAVDYPPELLILLHTVWPLEWVFMLFAGKKVR